jgi:hypothetical protein
MEFNSGFKGLNIQSEITYSTTVFEFNTPMALVVLMQRCNFVSGGTQSIDSTEATGRFAVQTIYQGVPHLYYLSERSGLVVKKLDCQTYNWRFEAKKKSCLRNLPVKHILALTIQGQGFGLRIFSVKIPRIEYC